MWMILCFGGIFVLSSCQEGTDAGSEEVVCEPFGHWRAVESRAAGDCAPDRTPESMVTLEIGKLDMAEQDALWSFELARGGVRLESCSGVPSTDHCRIEITCSGGDDEDELDFALTVNLTKEGSLTGSNVLTLHPAEGDECQAEFTLEGEQVSPLELESSLPEEG